MKVAVETPVKTIDLNADIGEAEDEAGIASECAILKFVSSASIACGGHRGDDESMARMVSHARRRRVQIGAHPSYPDREGFGRISKRLDVDISAGELSASLIQQITRLAVIAARGGAKIQYIKPHGALYNDAVNSRPHADLIASVIALLDKRLGLMGAPGSEMEKAAKRFDLRFISEGFIDRRYTDDGHLQSRTIDGAVIGTTDERMAQLRALITDGRVTTASGKSLLINCESLCLHGDSDDALLTAKRAHETIAGAGMRVKAFYV